MNNSKLEKAVFKAIHDGNWNNAIEHASRLPPEFNIWERMPSASPNGMPEHAVRKVIDLLSHKFGQHGSNLPSFLYSYSRSIPHDASPEWLNDYARIVNKYPDQHRDVYLTRHPNYKPDAQAEALHRAGKFWRSYESGAQTHHFATVKSMFTGQPEKLKDHKQSVGTSVDHAHLIPDLHAHAKGVQEKIMNDDDIPKRYFNGKPYIKLHRGVNGHYGKAIRKAVKFTPGTNEIKKQLFLLPTAHLTSWSTNPNIAHKFAHNWGETIPGEPRDQGLTMSQWLPVDSILHSGSGLHDSAIGQIHSHPEEDEIVVGHPEGKMKISTTDMHFQDTDPDNGSDFPMVKPTVTKSEELFKSTANKMASAMTAFAMLGVPHTTSTLDSQTAPEPHQYQYANQIQAPDKLEDNPELKPIKMIESSGKKDPAHPLVGHGVNAGTKAIGQYGLMPVQVIDTLTYDKHLGSKYPHLLELDPVADQDKIHAALKKDPALEKAIANSHWKRLHNRFDGDIDKMAYAWNNGITGATNASDDEIKNHPYVQKYHKFNAMLSLEQKPKEIKKSESSASLKSVEKFIPLTATQQDQHAVHLINQAITSGNLHNLSNVGHFTHDSFLVGFERDNSWLIKVESIERPGVKSASRGLQSIKEVAFYDAASRVFNLGQFTPKAILGEVIRDGKNWPAAAIKMFPDKYVSAAHLEEQKPGSIHGIMEKYRRNGMLHKMAIMLYILGDVDSHGNNWLTDGTNVKMIDHGTSFADAEFGDKPESGVFIPYILRQGYIKEGWSAGEKLHNMPRIDDPNVEEQVRHWVFTLDVQELMAILEKFYIDPRPTLVRLKLVQKMMKKENGSPDEVINSLWVTVSDRGERENAAN
jgi:hypothetical protein